MHCKFSQTCQTGNSTTIKVKRSLETKPENDSFMSEPEIFGK